MYMNVESYHSWSLRLGSRYSSKFAQYRPDTHHRRRSGQVQRVFWR